jgi:hypothetical protein
MTDHTNRDRICWSGSRIDTGTSNRCPNILRPGRLRFYCNLHPPSCRSDTDTDLVVTALAPPARETNRVDAVSAVVDVSSRRGPQTRRLVESLPRRATDLSASAPKQGSAPISSVLTYNHSSVIYFKLDHCALAHACTRRLALFSSGAANPGSQNCKIMFTAEAGP